MNILANLSVMARRVRIRSAKDIVLIFIIGLVMYGVQELCTKKFDMEPRTASVIGVIVAFVLALILIFSFD